MSINLLDFFTCFKGTPNQKAAIGMLAEVMPASLMVDDPAGLEIQKPEPVPSPLCLPSSRLICEFEELCSLPL